MVQHIVLWKLADTAAGADKATNARLMKEKLEALVGVIPGLLEATVGFNFNGGTYDVALTTRFTDREALAVYADHPAHVEVKSFVHAVATERTCVDCEL